MTLEPNFETTLAAARAGAEWAWTTLYREFAPGILRYLRARGARDPEDALGEIFVQVVKKLPEFRGDESDFKAWLFAIARNRLIDEARYRARRPDSTALDASGRRETAGAAGNPAEIPSDRLTTAQVNRFLDHLTPEQRDVLFLRVLAGLTIDETAQVLGKTSGSVKRLQSRGLRSLRKKILDGVVSF